VQRVGGRPLGFEAPAVVPDLDEVAVVGQAVLWQRITLNWGAIWDAD
jgi:hypothetical protein